MWQCQTDHQNARLAQDKASMANTQAEWAKLRRQALWTAASPGCLAWCWRWISLPRSLRGRQAAHTEQASSVQPSQPHRQRSRQRQRDAYHIHVVTHSQSECIHVCT